jgi:hypothetical protein
MDNQEFINHAIKLVTDYTLDHLDKTDSIQNVIPYVVWSCKVLGNNKALLSTPISDGMYYEVTYNGDRNEIYFDAYKKFENRCIELGATS